jgi:phage shock protein C
VSADSRHNDSANDEGRSRSDFQRSVDRLERAVQGFVSAANDQISTKAAGFIDETAQRLERELRDRNRSRSSEEDNDSREARRARRRARRRRRIQYTMSLGNGSMSPRSPGYRTSRLYVDRRHRRISGVCAGIARYFGVEVWVVRGVALTGLIFMASIVVPAYFILAWVLPKGPEDEMAESTESTADDHSSPAPELGTRLSPRGSLRNVQADLDQLELKLRRMESHVTSGQFELQRELKRIDV